MQNTKQTTTIFPLERFFAVTGAVVCLIISILLWLSISKFQAMWPFPGLYFIEMAALGVISAFTFVRGGPSERFITWGGTGVIGAFSIVGAFSVGFFYLPVALIFTVISITSDVRNKQRIAAHLGVSIIAGIVQVAVMFAAIQTFSPGTVF